MVRQVGLLALTLRFTSPLALAQHCCPEGFAYAGTLSRTSSSPHSALNEGCNCVEVTVNPEATRISGLPVAP